MSDIINEYVEIDCFQNLLIGIIKYQGINTFIPGGCWPWKFAIHYDNEVIVIENNEIISSNLLKETIGISYQYERIEHGKKNIEIIGSCLDKDNDFIILGVDQYFIPYQKPSIYMKKHGDHTLVLYGGLVNGKVKCVSSIPQYKGELDIESLQKAIDSSYLESWKVNIDFTYKRETDRKSLLDWFFNSFDVQNYYDEFNKKKREVNTAKLYEIFDELRRNNDLKHFCDGTWGWNLHKRGKILLYFLAKMTRNIEWLKEISNITEEIDCTWKILYRKIYMKTLSETVCNWETVDFLFKKILESEEVLRKKIFANRDHMYKENGY